MERWEVAEHVCKKLPLKSITFKIQESCARTEALSSIPAGDGQRRGAFAGGTGRAVWICTGNCREHGELSVSHDVESK